MTDPSAGEPGDAEVAVMANPAFTPARDGWEAPDAAAAFHRRLPGYEPTTLVSVPWLAERCGVGELLVKCELERFGLPAFKVLGASWAIYRALGELLGGEPGPWADLDELAQRVAPLRPLTLAAATDGNHGLAVARMARLLGLSARIFVPGGASAARVGAIAEEGAEVIVVDGDYDLAVARSAGEAGPRCLVVSDTGWPGYERVPRWVIEGYGTLFAEIDDALAGAGRPVPDAVFVPVGVGALAAAAVEHFSPAHRARPAIIGVEPRGADCVSRSLAAGAVTTVHGPHRSIMVGLNCGTPSLVAWPVVSRGLRGVVTVGDAWARSAVRDLAAAGVDAGETGAAGLAGLAALRSLGPGSPLAEVVPPDASVLVICTEGPGDRVQWQRILGIETVGADGELVPGVAS